MSDLSNKSVIMNQCSDLPLPCQWNNLQRDILAQVADRLGLIDLIKFRLVCKDFLSASSTAAARIEYLPWFLVYGQGYRCSLLSYGESCPKTYTLYLPQLRGATCLASSQGWLLVFRRGGSIFFYCPFSDVRIVLPKFPKAKLTRNYTAAFSSPIWSKDCVVTVICRCEKVLELNVLRFNHNWVTYNNWVTHKIKYEGELDNTKGTVYHGGIFYFLDSYRHGVTYCPEKNLITTYFDGRNKEIIFSPDSHQVKTYPQELPSEFEQERHGLGTEVALGHSRFFFSLTGGFKDASISTCGTLMHYNHIPTVIYNENIQNVRSNRTRRLKGVWIHPTFFDI